MGKIKVWPQNHNYNRRSTTNLWAVGRDNLAHLLGQDLVPGSQPLSRLN